MMKRREYSETVNTRRGPAGRARPRFASGPALLVLLLGVGGTPPARAQYFAPLGDPQEGERLFETKGCIRCHRAGGRGGDVGPDLSTIGEGRNFPQLAGLLWNHSPRMTARMRELGIPRPELTAWEMADLMAYLYALGYFDEGGSAARGAVLFRAKRCSACHSVGGEGGSQGPPAERLGEFGAPILMIQAMWNHGPEMQRRMEALGIPRLAFQGSDMADLLAFFRERGGKSARTARAVVPGNPQEGWKLFTIDGCIRCHAVEGRGAKLAPDLGRQRLPRTPSTLAGALWNHGARMRELMPKLEVPAPTLTGPEVSDLVAYLYFIGFFGPPADPAQGRLIFARKGCANCHAVGRERHKPGPNLARSEAVLSPVEAARLMWNHASRMEARMLQFGVAWPVFEGDEMAHLLAYLTSLPEARRSP